MTTFACKRRVNHQTTRKFLFFQKTTLHLQARTGRMDEQSGQPPDEGPRWLLCGHLLPHPEDSREQGWRALTRVPQGPSGLVRVFPFIHFL